jgi:hypothetical protein
VSKKGYVALASAIAELRRLHSPTADTEDLSVETDLLDEVTRRIAGVLAEGNPRFDRRRFYQAAGVKES